MAHRLTDSLKHERFSVVDVDRAAGRLRVRAVENVCTDVSCEGARIYDESGLSGLDRIYPGDTVTMEHRDGRLREVTVVRRAYDEYSGPGW
jgi:hypothetical protein